MADCESLAEKLDKAYCRGWDDAEKAIRESSADLLERSGRKWEELEKNLLFMKQQRSIAEEALRQWEGNYVDLRAEMDVLEERVEQLTKALKFYANVNTYVALPGERWAFITLDRGRKGREALSDLKKEEEGDG